MEGNTIVREWDEYHGGPIDTARDRLHVTLSGRALILLNRNVFKLLGEPEWAMLLYDRRNHTIGVRPAGPTDIKPFPVKRHIKGSHHYIHAKPFCRHHNILPTEHVRFTTPELNHEGILILDLQQTEPVVPKKRKPRMAA